MYLKNLLLVLALTLSSAVFAGNRYVAGDLQGQFDIVGVDVDYRATITLSSRMGLPVVKFVENMGEEYECKGLYSVSYGSEVDLSMYCGDLTYQEVYMMMMNGEKPDFTQNINLKNVSRRQLKTTFTTTVKSSLYNNIPLKFKFTRK